MVLWLSYVGLYLNRRNVSIVMPVLMTEMRLDHAQTGFLVTAFFIIYALIQIPSGWLADRVGGKKVATLGNAITAVSSYASGWASSYSPLLLTRFFCGSGQGMGWPSSTKLVAEWFPHDKRGVAMGILTSSVALGSFLALVLAGLFLSVYDWHAVFFIPALILTFITVIFWLVVKDHPNTVIVEAAAKDKVFRRQVAGVLKDRVMTRIAFSYFCWKYAFEGLFYWLPAYFVETFGLSGGNAGMLAGLVLLMGLGSMPLGGLISDRVRRREHVILFSLIPSGALLLFLSMANDYWLILFILLLASFLFQLSEGVYFVIPVDRFGSELTGVGVGLINLVGQIGTLLAPWLAGIIIDNYHSYSPTFLMFGLTALIGVVITSFQYLTEQQER